MKLGNSIYVEISEGVATPEVPNIPIDDSQRQFHELLRLYTKTQSDIQSLAKLNQSNITEAAAMLDNRLVKILTAQDNQARQLATLLEVHVHIQEMQQQKILSIIESGLWFRFVAWIRRVF